MILSALTVERHFEGGNLKHISYSGSSGELDPEIIACEWIELRIVSPGGGEEVIDRVNGPPPDHQDLPISGYKRLTQIAPGQYGFKLVGGKGLDTGESAIVNLEFRDQLSGKLQFDESLTNQELGSSTNFAEKTVNLGRYNLQISGIEERTGDKTKAFTLLWNTGIGTGSFTLSQSTFESQFNVIGDDAEQGSCHISDSTFSALSVSKLWSVDLSGIETEALLLAVTGKPVISDCDVSGTLTISHTDHSSIQKCKASTASFTDNNKVEIAASEFGNVDLEICQQLILRDTVTFALAGNHLKNLDMSGCAIQREASLNVSESCKINNSDFLKGAALWLRQTNPDISGSAFMDTLSIDFPSGTTIPNSMPITDNGFFGSDALRIKVDSWSIPLSQSVALSGNYWGSPKGPTGSYFNGRSAEWLDELGGTYPHFPKNSKAYRSTEVHAVSGLVADEPFPHIWVDDYCAGQHTLTRLENNRLPVRAGREMMICYDVRSNVPSVSGLEFWIELNGNHQKKIYPYFKSCQTIKREYTGTPSLSLNRTVNFVIPENMVTENGMTISLHCDGSGVSGYSTDGPRETEIFHYISFTPWKPRSEPLRIGVINTHNSLPGYKSSVDWEGNASALRALLMEEIPSMLPVREDELEIVILPSYRYGKKFSTFIGSLFNSVLNTVSWSMHRELEKHLEEINKNRTDKLHYLIAVVPRDSLDSGTSGETIEGSKVARVREDRHWAALHEFLHMLHLYERGAEQYDLPTGRDTYGNLIDNGSGAHVMGTSAFIPGDASGPNADNRHYPAGRQSGRYDIMGVSPNKWPVPSTLNAAFSGLGLSLPGKKSGMVEEIRTEKRSAEIPRTAPAGTRRVLFTGIAERAADSLEFQLIPGSIQARDVSDVMLEPITPIGASFDAKLIQYEVAPLVLQEVGLRQPSPGQGTLVLWQQTFDIPDDCTGFQIRVDSTNQLLYTEWDSGLDPLNTLTGISSGGSISDSTTLHVTVNGDPVQSQLFWRSGSRPWQPLGEVFNKNDDIPLTATGLATGADLSLMLLSSDGFRSTQTVIDQLNVANRAPIISITDPVSRTWRNEGAEWAFTANAVDPEDGVLNSGSWTSSIDGTLGSGSSIAAVVLSPGTHEISFTASDSSSRSSNDTIDVTVVEEGSIDLHVADSHLSWLRKQDDDFTIFLDTPRIGVSNHLIIQIPAPAEMPPFHTVVTLQQPDSSPEVILDEMLQHDSDEYRSLSYSFTPENRGTYKVTVTVEPPTGTTDLNPADNSYTWEFINQAPICSPQVVYCIPGQSVKLPLVAKDPEGDFFTFETVSAPTHGSLSGTLPNLIYTAPGSAGEDSLEIRATDGLATSDPVPITIKISPPVSAPVLAASSDIDVGAGTYIEVHLPFYFGTSKVELKSSLPEGLSFDEDNGILSGTVHNPGDLSLTLWAYNDAGVTANRLDIHSSESFSHWISQQGLPLDQSGPGDDPDGDGIQNLNEFAYGLRADLPDDQGIPYFDFHEGELDFIFRRRAEGSGSMSTPYSVDGIQYQLEMSTSLESNSWYSVPGYFSFWGIEEDGDPQIDTIRLRLLDFSILDQSDSTFFRLRVFEE